MGRFIVGYTVGNFVLLRLVSGAVEHDFRPYIRRFTSPNENFEYGYPHSNVLVNFYTSKTLYFVKNVSFVSDINHCVDQSVLATLLLTSGLRRYIAGYTCRKFLTLSIRTSRYIHKCIRILNILLQMSKKVIKDFYNANKPLYVYPLYLKRLVSILLKANILNIFSFIPAIIYRNRLMLVECFVPADASYDHFSVLFMRNSQNGA